MHGDTTFRQSLAKTNGQSGTSTPLGIARSKRARGPSSALSHPGVENGKETYLEECHPTLPGAGYEEMESQPAGAAGLGMQKWKDNLQGLLASTEESQKGEVAVLDQGHMGESFQNHSNRPLGDSLNKSRDTNVNLIGPNLNMGPYKPTTPTNQQNARQKKPISALLVYLRKKGCSKKWAQDRGKEINPKTLDFADNPINHKDIYLFEQPSDGKELEFDFLLDDLETIKVIGKGSGGVVQLVRHKWVGRLFALKVIQMNIQEDIRKQIVQELKINQASQCPHVVVCYHSFYHNGVISLVLEYMDRGSLADVIKQVKTILEPYLAVVCKQVLQGLVYLHNERHVIHRDIKPSNLLVNHKGEVKITDFGVSAMLASSMGQRDTFVGTYNYMSPERISGSTYDYSSDIWSLGMVVLECAIGRFPYIQSEDQQSWPSFYELLAAIVESPPPSAPPDQFSPEFCTFVSSCEELELLKKELMATRTNLKQALPDRKAAEEEATKQKIIVDFFYKKVTGVASPRRNPKSSSDFDSDTNSFVEIL
ncbi:hypothetical protein JHK85_028314 [Glycine max]|nr:hypothetical protein JHK85_028314 [Glycine max]